MQRRIDNWPPGFFAPEGYVNEPPGIERRIVAAQQELTQALLERQEWRIRTEKRRYQAWKEYYDAQGWPSEDDCYKNKIEKLAGGGRKDY